MTTVEDQEIDLREPEATDTDTAPRHAGDRAGSGGRRCGPGASWWCRTAGWPSS